MNLKEEQSKLEIKVRNLENDLLIKKAAGKTYAKEILANRSDQEKQDLIIRLRERLGNDPDELERLTREAAEQEDLSNQEAVIKVIQLDWQPMRTGDPDPEDYFNLLLSGGMPAGEAWEIIRLEMPGYYNKLRGDQGEG